MSAESIAPPSTSVPFERQVCRLCLTPIGWERLAFPDPQVTEGPIQWAHGSCLDVEQGDR
jgi:hypothetical protein